MLRSCSIVRRAILAASALLAVSASAEAAGKHSALRKFLLPKGDANEAQALQSGAKVLAQYKAFTLYGIADTSKAALTKNAGAQAKGISERIELRGGRFHDTRRASVANASVKTQRAQDGGEFQVLQFIGPVQKSWTTGLNATGVKVVSYMPDNGYVVWIDDATRKSFETFVSSDFVQWSGNFEPSWRRSPKVEVASLTASGNVDITVQLLDGPDTKATLAKLRALATRVLQSPSQVLSYMNISVSVPAGLLADISSWPDVFNVEEYLAPSKRDEAQGQIMAGNLTTAGGNVVPQGPGYLSWLASKGFPTTPESYPVVDIVDDGIDVGDAVNVRHPDFRRLGDSSLPSRLNYLQTCTSDPLGDGKDGHGNINAGIVGGYNNRTSGFPYQDDLGYRYGLGISPYGRLAGTRIFGSSGSFDISGCGGAYGGILQRAYASGARITSNSWGSNSAGGYSAASQAFDAATRDASSTMPGNQEILHVISAGNAGRSGSQTVGAPGTGKNVLTVGATENVRAEGTTDGCGSSVSNNADDIADFSSRGPTSDGRIKPDIVAPGVHITGPASQSPLFTGNSVCGMGSSGIYYPLGQTLYTWSTGTSHSCPAVSGTAQLTYEYYGRVLKPGAIPSPAMLKALIVNSARYINGVSSGGTLPSANQGWGDVNMGSQFDNARRELVDQTVVFQQTGDEYSNVGQVFDPTKPLRISLVWTDAPGNTTGASYVNDLDLEVAVNGVVYKGNVFNGAFSTTGGSADGKNNIENVFLPAGTTGSVSIRVVAKNIAGDGIPGNADITDQDFALVAYNVSVQPRAILAADSVLIRKVVGNPLVGIEAGDSLEIATAIRNAGNLPLGPSAGRLSTQDPNASIGTSSTSYSALDAGARAWGVQRYGVRISTSLNCGNSVVLSERVVSGADTVLRQILLPGRTSIVSDTSVTVPRAINDRDSTFATITSSRVGTIAAVKVRVGLTHTFDGDLIISLVAPSGKRIVLANRVGSAGANFSGTIFDDSAALPIASGSAPFTGSFRPTGSLSSLIGDTAQGIWKLVVSDNAGADYGTLTFFALDFKMAGAGCAANTAPVVRIVTPARGSVIPLGDSVMFQATATDDGKPAPSSLTYKWKVVSGPSNIAFSDTASPISFARLSTEGAYKVRFTANDGQLTGADSVSFQVLKPLAAPTGIVATAKPGAILISWDSISSPGVHYFVYRSIGDSLNFNWADSTASTSYLDRNLMTGTTYYYKVASVRDTAYKLAPQIVSAQPGKYLISGLRLVPGNRSVRVSWNPLIAGGTASSWTYQVARGTSVTGPFTYLPMTTDSAYLDSGMAIGSRYVYFVAGISSDALVAASAQDTITPRVDTLLAPANFQAIPGGHSVTLRWSPVASSSQPLRYELHRMGLTPSDTMTAIVTDTQFVDRGLVNGVLYFYELRARNPNATSTSTMVMAVPRSDTLASPGNFRASAGSHVVTLRWSPVISAVQPLKYELHRMGAMSTDDMTFTVTDTVFVDQGLRNGVVYHYDLRATNPDTTSFPTMATATPRADTLASPRNFRASAGSHVVTLRWSPVASAAQPVKYELHRLGAMASDDSTFTVTDTVFVDQGLTNGVTYYYDLRATNPDTTSFPTMATATPRADTLASPRNFRASAGSHVVTLRWSPVISVAQPLKYELHRMGAMSTDDMTFTVTDTVFVDQGLRNGVVYHYDLRATNPDTTSFPTMATAIPRADTLGTPRNFRASTGSHVVTLRWSPVVSAAQPVKYELHRLGAQASDETTFTVTDTVFVDQGLTNGVTYYYDLRATNPDTTSFPALATAIPHADTLGTPRNFRASAASHVVTLRWSPVVSARQPLKYELYRFGAMSTDEMSFTVTDTVFIDQGLRNGVMYRYELRATNPDTSSAPAMVSVTPQGEPLSAPVWSRQMADDRKALLGWHPVASTDGPVSYSLMRRLSTETAMSLIQITSDTFFVDTPLVNRSQYVYALIATNSVTSSPVSALATIEPYAQPEPITNFTARLANRGAWLNWQVRLEPNDTIELQRSTFATGPFQRLASVVDTTFTDNSIQAGVTYYYIAYHKRFASRSAVSAEVSVLLNPPATPAHLTVVPGVRSLSVTWDTVAGVQYYQLRRESGSDHLLATFLSSTHSYLDTGLVVGRKYTYSIAAENQGGRSVESDTVSGVPLPAAPAVPTGIVATAGIRSVTVAWNASVGATGYSVYRSADSVTYAILATPVANNWIDSSVVAGSRYWYYVKATNAAGSSAASSIVTAIPKAPIPAAPAGVAAIAGDKTIRVTWSAVAGATSYSVKTSTVSGGPYTIAQSGLASTSFDLTGLVNGTAYYVVVSASNATGEGANSLQVSATPVQASSLKIQYKLGDANATDNTIRPLLQIANTGATAVNLSDLTIRYWYTNEQAKGQVMWCDWAQVGSANVLGSYRALATSVPGADGYMEISFKTAAGVLAANGGSGEIQIRITRTDWSNHTETGDWSYDATKTAYADWDHVTLYKAGVLVWGKEPGVTTPPSVPTGLRGSVGNRVDTLTWNAAANATSYNVYRNLVGGVSVKIANTSSPFFVDTGLVNGTSYVYRVSGVNASMESAKSDSVMFAPRGVAPAKVTGLVATAGNRIVNLVWNTSATATSYRVLRRGALLATVTGTVYADSTALNDTTYSYRIVASNVWGDAPMSDSVFATPRAPLVPGVPSVVHGSAGNRLDTISWSQAANATSYNVYRNLVGGTPVKIASTTSLYIVDTGLVNGTGYVYRVSGVNGQLESAKSDSVLVTPRGVAPSKVTGLVATAGNRFVNLVWNASSTATSYKVLRRGALLATVTGTVYADSAVVNDTTYSYRIVASNVWGDAPMSDSVFATPRAPLVPGVPSVVHGSAGNRLDTISWSQAANATSYNVYRNLVGGAPVKIASTTSLYIVDTGLVNGTGYVYRVSGVNGQLESAKSDSVLVTPRGVAPSKVTGLVATAGNRFVNLVWNASSTATSYKVLRRGALLATVTGTVYADSSVVNDTTYSYRIVASNVWGDAPVSDSATATPRAPVGGLKVQYKVGAAEASTNGIKPFLQVVNTGTTAIPLSEVTVRYWFSNDGTQGASYWCDWAQVGSANVVGTIKVAVQAKPTADRYLELSFKATTGNLAAGASTGEIQNRFSKSDWSNYTQTNDASFDATRSAYADYAKVTVYRNGVLVWGAEP